ncbi:MAG: capsular polysaccharide synthesis protein [Bacteroidota bacterium]
MTENNSPQIPRKIWFLWLQGYDDMPEVVRKSYDSWRKYNGSWEIIFLDTHNFDRFVDLGKVLENRGSEIPRVTMSELIRINLMAQHGGVWVDATCFCCKPLDDWLLDHLQTGFFAFDRPGTDRMLSSWFLASEPGSYIAQTYARAATAFWETHKDLVFVSKRRLWHRLINRSGLYSRLKADPPRWFSSPFTRWLKVYPYYWFHYTFEKVYREDATFREHWDRTPKISADSPHRLWNQGLATPISAEVKKEVDQRSDPLYKLTWKVNDDMFSPGSGLEYLLYHSGH